MSPYLYRSAIGHEYQQISQELQKIVSNSHALAYLWLALESNCSILICGEDPNANKYLLKSLINFIPSSESVIIIEKDFQRINSDNLPFNLHSLYGKGYGINIEESIENALKINSDWIIVDEICNREAKRLFNSIDFGSSFISTIKENVSGHRLASKLISVHTDLDPGRLSCLDVSISLDVKRNKLSIYEYLWLSRGEIEHGIDIKGRDLLQFKEITPESKELLQDSKVVQMYSNMTGFSISQSIGKIESKSMELAGSA